MNKAFEKIKVASAEIVVHGTSEKPYYEIRYYDISDGKYHIGYSSYDLSIVFGWLKKCFEIVQEVSEEYNGGWISVKDRLPDKAGSYLVIGKSGGATVTRWYMPSEFYPEGHFGGNSADYIRYWMPRPEPPKERD